MLGDGEFMPVLTLDGDASGAVRATAAVATEAKKLVPVFKEISDATDKAGDSHSKAFGEHTLGELAKYAAEMMGVHKAVEFVTDALRAQAEEKRKAAENVTGGLSGAGMIANISSNQQEFDRNVAFGRRLMDEGIVPRNQQDSAMSAAANVAASGASDKDRDFLIDLGKKKRIKGSEIGSFASNIERFREGFDGKAGSFEDVAKEFLYAGSRTLDPESGPADVGRQAVDIAKAAADAGMPADKALAMYTALARSTKSSR